MIEKHPLIKELNEYLYMYSLTEANLINIKMEMLPGATDPAFKNKFSYFESLDALKRYIPILDWRFKNFIIETSNGNLFFSYELDNERKLFLWYYTSEAGKEYERNQLND